MGAFIVYHIVKSILWRRGIYANFFYKTRFTTFPILIFGMIYNVKHSMREMDKAGVLDYSQRRLRFDRDSELVEKLFKNHFEK